MRDNGKAITTGKLTTDMLIGINESSSKEHIYNVVPLQKKDMEDPKIQIELIEKIVITIKNMILPIIFCLISALIYAIYKWRTKILPNECNHQ